MKQVRLLLAEWLLSVAFNLMPNTSEEKKLLASLLTQYNAGVMKELKVI